VISFARKLAPAFGTDLKDAYNCDTSQPSFIYHIIYKLAKLNITSRFFDQVVKQMYGI
jgi:hypothetical protein